MSILHRAMLAAVAFVTAASVAPLALAGEPPAVPPRLHQLLSGARTVVSGRVSTVQELDSGRVAIAEIAVDGTLKGDDPGDTVRVVELRSLPSAPVAFRSGEHVLAFLSPVARNSYLRATLPEGSYLQASHGREGVVAAEAETPIAEAAALVGRMVAASREPEPDRAKRAAQARALVFDELAARHPAVVEDGIAGLGSVPGLEPLASGEKARLEALVARDDLPPRVRERLFTQIGALGLQEMVPALRGVAADDPQVTAAAWRALRRLGAPPDARDLARELRSTDPAVRSAAAAELLARGPQEIPRVTDLALGDPDPEVRVAVLGALAETGSPEALPTLERAFADPDWEVRQAAGRAIFQIGGRPAAETFARLTLNGPRDAQQYALTLLRATGVGDDDPLLVRIRNEHPDARVRRAAEHGLATPEH